MQNSPFIPTLLAVTAAFLFALGAQCSRMGLRYASAADGVRIQVTCSAALYWLAAPIFLETRYWVATAVLLFAAIGAFRPFLSSRLAMASYRHVGPTITMMLAGTSPLVGVALGVLVLGEDLTPTLLIGTAAIFAGVTLISLNPGGLRRGWPLWALLLPIGAAIIRATANLLAKLGMEIVPSPYFVGLIGTTIAAALALGLSRGGAGPAIVRNAGFKWFLMTGASLAFASLLLNTALNLGTLVAVSPISAVTPLFSLLLGASVFREGEINLRVVAAMALIVPSIVAITMGY